MLGYTRRQLFAWQAIQQRRRAAELRQMRVAMWGGEESFKELMKSLDGE
ncbi:MAG TPA: hypothetical protein VFS13_00610 [Steroidobacteraceae bacterium]|nr:hypothetical protein [Steroidobacteraceae bacterium]